MSKSIKDIPLNREPRDPSDVFKNPPQWEHQMIATKVNDVILITAEHILDGQLVLETSCNDFDDYKRLPEVVSYKGNICTKTGWSSDTGRCCYKQGGMIAYKAKK